MHILDCFHHSCLGEYQQLGYDVSVYACHTANTRAAAVVSQSLVGPEQCHTPVQFVVGGAAVVIQVYSFLLSSLLLPSGGGGAAPTTPVACTVPSSAPIEWTRTERDEAAQSPTAHCSHRLL